MPVSKSGRYIPEDETDERVQELIEARPDLIWFAEEDPDEPDYFLISDQAGVLDTIGLYSEEIEQRANRVVDRHNKAIRKAIRAAIERIQPTLSEAVKGPDPVDKLSDVEDWLAYRPIVMVKLSDLVLVSEVNYLALSEGDRTEYDRITAVFTQGYKWAREIDQDGQRYAVFVHPSFADSIVLAG